MLAANNDDLIIDSTDDLDDLNDDFVNDYENGKNSKCENSKLTEDDKRKRRAIANSNERRRMQSINAGFQTLKNLIPHSNGEKLSKACILQRSADYMQYLSKEKEKLNYKLQIAIKLIETNGLLSQLKSEITLEDAITATATCFSNKANQECQKISHKQRKSISSISSILKSDCESRQLTDSTNKKHENEPPPPPPLMFKIIDNFKTSDEDEVEVKAAKSRSNSIDQLIAAAAVTASSSTCMSPQSPASSCQASNSTSDLHKKNLNLNTIFEAIKHVEGKNLDATDVHKPPKKRKYTTDDINECNLTSTPQTPVCYIDLNQLNALSLSLNHHQTHHHHQSAQFTILTSNESKSPNEDETVTPTTKKPNDKIIGLLVTST